MQRHYFADKGPFSQSYGFSSSYVWMWELDHEESWAPKNWCFWTVMLEKTFESPLDYKEIQPVNPKGNQSWIFIGRTDAEAEAPTLWPSDAKSWLIRKDSDAGKNWRQEVKGTTEDEVVRWHHWMDMSLSKFQEMVNYREAWCAAVHRISKSQTWLSGWTTGCVYALVQFSSVQFNSVAQSCPSLCNPMNRSTLVLPVHHQLPEFTQTHVHRVGDAIQPSHPLSSSSPPVPNPSQHQSLFQWVNSSHEVAKVLEFQLQRQSFQWTPRTDLL